MKIPGFTAEAVFQKRLGSYRSIARSVDPRASGIIPAIPFCGNCPDILDRCARNGGRPRAVCRACEIGDCFSGVERPPQLLDPFGHRPGGF
jgi:hypothetical protein